jgi:hypothetical protein
VCSGRKYNKKPLASRKFGDRETRGAMFRAQGVTHGQPVRT